MSPKFSKLLMRVSKILKFALLSQVRVMRILKFHERVISALILVTSFARPKISSQFLRVNESLKFEKNIKIHLRYFYPKGRQGDLNFASQARNCMADTKSVPLSPFLNPPNPSHVQGACDSANALHAVCF